MSVAPAVSQAEFATAFREHVAQYVEYSFDADPRNLGLMIFGEPHFLDELARFAARFAFAGEWVRAVHRFAAATNPVNYLFKVDWKGMRVSALSLYCRFVENLSAADLESALTLAAPLTWDGPSPAAIGRSLGATWPHGIGFRVNARGDYHAAVYHRVTMPSLEFRVRALAQLMQTCGLPPAIEHEMRRDMAMVHGPGPVGVVGVDAGRDGRASAIKLDAEGVPATWALAFLAAREVAATRLAELRATLVRVGVRSLGYFGLKYDERGPAGWKIYLPLQPRLAQPAASPRLDVNHWTSAN